ncbi:MAG: M20/M25/M40 family metallo-hydrolase [Alphaproteobacteria bacterium]|nr:M20/M25/M40 family metallo-hydrolase [Alphaproteobacteria bacterium]
MTSAARTRLKSRLGAERDRLIGMARTLVRAASENPPGDTRAAAHAALELLGAIPGVEARLATAQEPMANVVAILRGGRPGRRFVFNGHLDTYAIGDAARWTVSPLAGIVKNDRMWGRGIADMKGGIAASLMAVALLAECREDWAGEIAVTLAADEETMGVMGTGFMLDTVPEALGDACLIGDVGSPDVIRFGEKGMVWVEISAEGRAAHGAHVHLGDNAAEKVMEAVGRLLALRGMPVPTPPEVAAAVAAAKAVSEPLNGAGESETLLNVTVNLGMFHAGSKINLIPDSASAAVDIRLPIGMPSATIKAKIAAALDGLRGVSYRYGPVWEPNHTDPRHELFGLLARNGAEVLGRKPVVNMRVGASDARLYRLKGVPTAVYGPAAHNMGGPDEHITLADLFAVADVHALTAFDFLAAPRA